MEKLLNPHASLGDLPRPEPIDPLSLLQNFEGMEERYLRGRWSDQNPDGEKDGFVLYCKRREDGFTYGDIRNAYVLESGREGFSEAAFDGQYFKQESTSVEVPPAPEGMTRSEYIRKIARPALMRDMSHYTDDGPHLYLPEPGMVPAGRFENVFPHDDMYHSLDKDQILGILTNQSYQIMRYGYPMNFNSIASAGRDQTIFFSFILERAASQFSNSEEILLHFREPLERYFQFLTQDQERLRHLPLGRYGRVGRAIRMADGTEFARYFDDMPVDLGTKKGGRLESLHEDHESAAKAVYGLEGIEKEQKWKEHMISKAAVAASCWDFSGRWSSDGQSLHKLDILKKAPVDLNANLVHAANMLARIYDLMGNDPKAMEKAARYRSDAMQRAAGINRYMYDPKLGIYRDCYIDGQQSRYISAAMAAPLFAGGIANFEQAKGVVQFMRKHMFTKGGGGIMTSRHESGQQWDYPLVWPGLVFQFGDGATLAAIEGKKQGKDVGMLVDAVEEAWDKLDSGLESYFLKHRKMPERLNGLAPAEKTKRGEYDPEEGFGMTNEVSEEIGRRDIKAEVEMPVISWRQCTLERNAGAVALKDRTIIV